MSGPIFCCLLFSKKDKYGKMKPNSQETVTFVQKKEGKMIKRFVSMMMSIVMIVMLIPAAAVFAGGDDIPEIKLNEKGYVKIEGKTGVQKEQYSFELQKPAVVRFEAGTYEHKISISRITSDGETSFILGTNTVTSTYLPKGKYIFEVGMQYTGDDLTSHSIEIEAFYLEVNYTKDGIERTLPFVPTTENPFDAFVENNSSVTIEVKATNGYDYSYSWNDYGTNGKADKNKYVINGFENNDCWTEVKVESEYSSIPLNLFFRKDPHLVFEQYGNYLVDPHSDITYDPQVKADTGYYTLVMSWWLEDYSPFVIEDLTYFCAAPIYFSVSDKGTYGDPIIVKEGSLYAFILYPENVKKIELGKEISVNVTRLEFFDEEFGTAEEIDKYEKIFSYTPEKTGTYTFSSKGNVDTYGAVFDSDRKCLACNDDLSGNYQEEYPDLGFNLGKGVLNSGDLNFSVTCELTAGKTYYFASTLNTFNYDLKKESYDYSVSLTCDTPDTPTPTATDKPTEEPTSTPAPTTKPAGESDKTVSFEDFVERLYVVALGRDSEPEGKAFWCEHVGNGDLTGADCAREFLNSKEFNDRKLSDEEFLKVLYKTFFDRDAADDPDGFSFWMNSLKTEGRDKIVDGFINSTEWCNICATYGVKSGATRAKATIASKNATAFATRLYTECLGRDPETEGLNFWSLGLTNLELTGKQAAHEFFFSKEFNDHNFDNKELLTRMYRTFMGREPDDDGMNFWLNNMKNGMTKEDVFNEFVKSKEFTEICQSYAIDRG